MTTETPTSKAARELLTVAGFRVTRINSGRVKVRRGWMHNAEAGTPDLLVEVVAPVYGWLEAKRPSGPMRKAQIKWHAEAKARGCLVGVFDTARQALTIASGWRNRIQLEEPSVYATLARHEQGTVLRVEARR